MDVPLWKGNLDAGLSEFFKNLKVTHIAPRRCPDIDPFRNRVGVGNQVLNIVSVFKN